jgi:hypothetical protein
VDREGTGVELAVGKRNSRAVSSESVLPQWWLSGAGGSEKALDNVFRKSGFPIRQAVPVGLARARFKRHVRTCCGDAKDCC